MTAGVLVGTVLGTLIGLIAAPEKYEAVAAPTTRIGAAQMPDGRIGVTVSRSF